MREDGSKIEKKCDYIIPLERGIFAAEINGKYSLYDKNGLLCDNLDAYYELCIEDRAGKNMLVINEGKYSYRLQGNPTSLDSALITDYIENNDYEKSYGLVDLFTGNVLLGFEYEQISEAGGYLYAYKNGGWEVYEIVFNDL